MNQTAGEKGGREELAQQRALIEKRLKRRMEQRERLATIEILMLETFGVENYQLQSINASDLF